MLDFVDGLVRFLEKRYNRYKRSCIKKEESEKPILYILIRP